MSNNNDLNNGITFKAAATRASMQIPIVKPTDQVKDVRNNLYSHHYESISYIVVCEGDRYVGIISIENLLVAQDNLLVKDIMDIEHPNVLPGVDQEKAAWQAIREKRNVMSVVDKEGRFVGLITSEQLLHILEAEHEEDLSRLSGLMKSTLGARASSEETVRLRFRHRLPWLLVGLIGALFSANLVGWFEVELSRKIALAFFMPGIVYMADAVGTQTETIVIRGLSVGVPFRKMIWRELLAGLVIGVVLAVISSFIIWLQWGDPSVVIIVALSLFSATAISTIIAMALPWIFHFLGKDPAFGSGPLSTVIQDLLSLLIYFYIAMLFLN